MLIILFCNIDFEYPHQKLSHYYKINLIIIRDGATGTTATAMAGPLFDHYLKELNCH